MTDKPQFLGMSYGVKMSVLHVPQSFVVFLHVPKCFNRFNLASRIAFPLAWCSTPKNDCFSGELLGTVFHY